MTVQPEFLPTTRAEMEKAGYEELDILLVTGDCYVDHRRSAFRSSAGC